jgi:hypothetical protein
MTDATGTYAQHPALVTATGPAAAPPSGPDATGTDGAHPAIVTRLPLDARPAAAVVAPLPRRRRSKPRRRRRPHRRRRHHARVRRPRFTG